MPLVEEFTWDTIGIFVYDEESEEELFLGSPFGEWGYPQRTKSYISHVLITEQNYLKHIQSTFEGLGIVV